MNDKPIEERMVSWFEGTLSTDEQEELEQWIKASDANGQLVNDTRRVWQGMEQLRRMKNYDSQKALRKIEARIENHKKIRLTERFQKVAAVLVLPLLVASLWLALDKYSTSAEPVIAWHTLNVPAGLRSEFYLPDSTKVYLNSKTSLSYPLVFNKNIREVKLSGEAYFEVTENKEIPFIVNTGKVNIEVTGTEFLAINYPHENLSEIVLINGGINLFQGDYLSSRKDIVQLHPGEKAFYRHDEKKMNISKVHTGKYRAWKEGILVFRDDPMPEVVRRLNRWFNVAIKLEGPKLTEWTYTATFEDESLEQVLELLKISAPIEYSIKRREMQTDKTFSKMEIIIRQK